MEDLLPAVQGSSSSTLGCGGDVSQRNLILQPSIPPARDVLAFSAQTNFLRDGKDWIFQDGEMQRKSFKGEWGLLCILGTGSCAGCQEHPAGPHSQQGEQAHHGLPCPELSNCCHLQFLTRRSSMGRAEKKKKRKKEKAKPSMVIRMNCLELDNQK